MNYLLRSCMFLPASNTHYIEKAIRSDADAIILDLEDSVPNDRRGEARSNIVKFANEGAFKDRLVFARINKIESGDFIYDMESAVRDGMNGVMPSKIYDADDIKFIDRLLDCIERKNGIIRGTMKLLPLIETANAVININSIASSSDRLIGLCFGGEDYLNDIGSVYIYNEGAFAVPRSLIINAARANDILPIDTPYLDVHDQEGFRHRAREAYKNGFAGNLVLSPGQAEVANQCFYPEQDIIDFSEEILKELELKENKDKNIIMHNERMIGPPMIKRALNVRRQIEGEG